VDLVNRMDDMYSFVDPIKNIPDKIKVLENTIMMILTQTVECAVFIREYSGHGFRGESFNFFRVARIQVKSRTTCQTDLI
jgi:hypothetical protein